MTCREFKERHPEGSAEARAHQASCPECRAFAESWELLKAYPPIAESPGFFQAVRRKLAPRILRFAAPVAAAAAVLLVAVVLQLHRPPAGPLSDVSDEERELVENLDLLQNYELVKTLEIVGDASTPLAEVKK